HEVERNTLQNIRSKRLEVFWVNAMSDVITFQCDSRKHEPASRFGFGGPGEKSFSFGLRRTSYLLHIDHRLHCRGVLRLKNDYICHPWQPAHFHPCGRANGFSHFALAIAKKHQ